MPVSGHRVIQTESQDDLRTKDPSPTTSQVSPSLSPLWRRITDIHQHRRPPKRNLSALFQRASKTAHPRDFGNLSKLSRVNEGEHYRSDPVRVQSTISGKCQQPRVYLENQLRQFPNQIRGIVGHRADARSRGQKLCCGRPQRGLLGRYRPQSAVSCSTLRERAA